MYQIILNVFCCLHSILGLDPAKPLYENSGPKDRLHITDAIFVDVIHTNGDKNGLFKSLGHIDFFPNGGKVQPNCGKSDKCNILILNKRANNNNIFFLKL